MMSKIIQIHLTTKFKVSPSVLYNAWLNSAEHSSFTGGDAQIEPIIGTPCSAWDDYISGKILELEPNKRILQTWRTTEFSDQDEDSILELLIEQTDTGCALTLNQWNIPEDQVSQYTSGWMEHYFEPMHVYFRSA